MYRYLISDDVRFNACTVSGKDFNNFEMLSVSSVCLWINTALLYEPRREKTGLRGFQPGPT